MKTRKRESGRICERAARKRDPRLLLSLAGWKLQHEPELAAPTKTVPRKEKRMRALPSIACLLFLCTGASASAEVARTMSVVCQGVVSFSLEPEGRPPVELFGGGGMALVLDADRKSLCWTLASRTAGRPTADEARTVASQCREWKEFTITSEWRSHPFAGFAFEWQNAVGATAHGGFDPDYAVAVVQYSESSFETMLCSVF